MYSPTDLQIRGSRIHGLGIFALRLIPAETRLLEYVGKLLTKEELANVNKTYCFTIDQEHAVDGAQVAWNPAGFFNHSCEPNCESRLLDRTVWIFTRRDIKPGEELTYNYGYRPEDLRQHPCRCGAPGCLGYMVAEDLFPIVKQLCEQEKAKK